MKSLSFSHYIPRLQKYFANNQKKCPGRLSSIQDVKCLACAANFFYFDCNKSFGNSAVGLEARAISSCYQ